MDAQEKIFDNLTAWFSRSVSLNKKKKWVQFGGKEVSFDDAQYIFSQNVMTPDTQRIFETEAYLDEHLAVFHANLICECVKKNSLKAVPVGKYFMPPKEVQEILRGQMTFQWDLDGNMSDGTTEDADDPIPSKEKDKSSKRRDSLGKEDNVHSSQRKTSGTKTPVASTSKRRDSPKKVTEKSDLSKKEKNNNKNSTILDDRLNDSQECLETTDSVAVSSSPTRRSRKQNELHKEDDKPQSHIDIYRIEDLPKVTGLLEDFVPGQLGCVIFPKKRKTVKGK